jgi:mono/diheme cytochrome c family protein
MLIIGNEATGQWMRNSALDNPKFLSRTIGDWLNSWQTAQKSAKSYADVPAFTFDAGEYIFRNHCGACHTIGHGDQLGPDLAGVTATRDHEWLARFIIAPDQVIASGDPIARSLLAKYQQVLMPNLALGAEDADLLIGYMETQSRAVANATAAAPRTAAGAATVNGDLTPILDPYLRIQRALNGDVLTGVDDGGRVIAIEAAKLGANGADIQAAAAAIRKAADLTAARTAFARLGDAIMIHARSAGISVGADVKVAYCPMVRKYWLQKGDTVQNPFYGKQMSDCGRFTADIPSLNR